MDQVDGLGQNEEVLGCGGLYLSEFLAEVLNKNIVEASTELRWLLADQLEALIQPARSWSDMKTRCSRASFTSGSWASWLIS